MKTNNSDQNQEQTCPLTALVSFIESLPCSLTKLDIPPVGKGKDRVYLAPVSQSGEDLKLRVN